MMSGWKKFRYGAGLLWPALLAVAITHTVSSEEVNPRLGKDLSIVMRAEAASCAWSPDSKRLAYSADGGIWIADAPRFSQVTKIAEHGSYQLSWSLDEKKLAFVDTRAGDSIGNNTIWIVNADGSGLHDALNAAGTIFFSGPQISAPQISAWLGTNQIAFARGCGTGCVELDKIDLQTGKPYSFCHGSGPFFWSPDRSRAIVDNEGSGPNAQGLGLVDPAIFTALSKDRAWSFDVECKSEFEGCVPGHYQTPGPRTLENELYRFNAWSSDSRTAFFTGLSCPDFRNGDLYSWNIQNGARAIVAKDAGYGAPSPDGSHIAFTRFGVENTEGNRARKGAQMYVAKLRGGHGTADSVHLSSSVESGLKMVPIWSPGSDRLIVCDADGDLLLFTADGKRKTMLLQGWKGLATLAYYMRGEASWSPDGKWISILVQEMRTPDATPGANAGGASGTPLGFGGFIGKPGNAPRAQPTFTQVLYVIANPKL